MQAFYEDFKNPNLGLPALYYFSLTTKQARINFGKQEKEVPPSFLISPSVIK